MTNRFHIYLILVILGIGISSNMLFAGSKNVTRVGEWGTGNYSHTFVQGTYAYCTAGAAGLDIIDISDPFVPRRVGNIECSADKVFVKGTYAYAADYDNGLKIIDVSSSSTPILVGEFEVLFAGSVFAAGNYVYLTDTFGEGRLQIIDVSIPSSPRLAGSYEPQFSTAYITTSCDAVISGDYAYVMINRCDELSYNEYSVLHILDISDPSSPLRVGTYDGLISASSLFVKDNTVYAVESYRGLHIIDVSNPASPLKVGMYRYKEGTVARKGLYVRDNYAYIGKSDVNDGLLVVDISNPSSPGLANDYNLPSPSADVYGVTVSGDYVYLANYNRGLQILDISVPSSPAPAGNLDILDSPAGVHVIGNYAYVADEEKGLCVVDVSSPSHPVELSTTGYLDEVYGVFARGNYAYMYGFGGMQIIDVSVPSTPVRVGSYAGIEFVDVAQVNGNHAYIAGGTQFHVVDVSNPSSPTLTGSYTVSWVIQDIFVSGNYAAIVGNNKMEIIDISNPSAPSRVGLWSGYTSNFLLYVHVSGNYAYVVEDANGLHVIDISDPTQPIRVGHFAHESTNDIHVAGDYAYLTSYDKGLWVLDISTPTAPRLVGNYDMTFGGEDVYVSGEYIYVTDRLRGKFYILSFQAAEIPLTRIKLDRTRMNFGFIFNTLPEAQTFTITGKGKGTLNWSVSTNRYWLTCSPAFGADSGKVSVSVGDYYLEPGTYTAVITVSAPYALNTPQTIDVFVNVYAPGASSAPFGEFATPVDGSMVSGSIPVTGWVLDDIGTQIVQVFREENGSLVYIGDAVFVEGARPDVEQAYPGYPMNYKAGWGYMMLTNYLPDGGNGTFKLHAIATDIEGNQVSLGTKTIICDNANAVKPFGAIDTPTQGGIASGSQFVNFGWVLTPLPNTIPTDGSTITVWVDGVSVGHPVYNQYRADVAALFPGYNNSSGAVGYFYLDTTAYENGVHTIQWTASDDAGNTDGIGSRYFTIQNTAERGVERTAQHAQRESRGGPLWPPISDRTIPIDYSTPVSIKKGYDKTSEPQIVYPGEDGIIYIEIEELERLEIQFPDPEESALTVSSLPIGSTFDAEGGVFSWIPGPGFIGEYRFVFFINTLQNALKKTNPSRLVSFKYHESTLIGRGRRPLVEKGPGGQMMKKNMIININIIPKFKEQK